MGRGAHILASRLNAGKPMGPPARPTMQNKANSKEVSSLKSQVSRRRGQATNHPTSQFTLAACRKTSYGVTTSRACVRNKANSQGLLTASGRPVVPNKANSPGTCVRNKANLQGLVQNRVTLFGWHRQTRLTVLSRLGWSIRSPTGKQVCPCHPAVQNKANSRKKTRPRWPRHVGDQPYKQSQFPWAGCFSVLCCVGHGEGAVEPRKAGMRAELFTEKAP
jgi:hypothetical protein